MTSRPAPARTAATAPEGAERRVHVIQGEYHVTDDADVVLTTLLGSCVAACLRDPFAGVGGMNHFLLPEGLHSHSTDPAAVRYGAHLMELLINGLLRLGARRERLEGKLFGGARVITGLTDVGSKNAEFAERYLHAEGITVLPGSLRGVQGRRVQFWPVSGRVRQLALVGGTKVFEAERRAPPPPPATDFGDVELF